jgi:hypothetical protein
MAEQHTILGGKVYIYKQSDSSRWQCSSYSLERIAGPALKKRVSLKPRTSPRTGVYGFEGNSTNRHAIGKVEAIMDAKSISSLFTISCGSRTCKPNSPGCVANRQVIRNHSSGVVNDVNSGRGERFCVTPASQSATGIGVKTLQPPNSKWLSPVYSRPCATNTAEVAFTHGLPLGRYRPNAAQLRGDPKAGGRLRAK